MGSATVGTPAGQREKYLFYRGVGHLDAMLRADRSADGESLEIRRQPFQDVDAPATDAIGDAWLAHIRADGSAAFLAIGRLDTRGGSAEVIAAVPARFAESDFSPGNLDLLRADMHRALVAEGLFDDEAAAMLDTWKEAYFHSPGLRLFFTVPQAWTDYYLPLDFSAPVDLTRVMVGRIEVVTPEQRELLAQIATRPAHPFPTSDLKALFTDESPGEWQDSRTYQQLVEGKLGLRDIDVELPASYLDFLDLGRLRHALLMDELRRRPTVYLQAFVDNYGFEGYSIPTIAQEPGTIEFQPDQPILDDALAAAWTVECKNGAEVLGMTTHGPIFNGRTSTVVRTTAEEAGTLWSMTLLPPQDLSRSGLAGVRLAFHPGDTNTEVSAFNLLVNDQSVNLAEASASGGLEMGRRDWQVVELPFAAFAGEGASDEAISRIRLEGDSRGTFYLDDLRLVGRVPSGLPTEPIATAAEMSDLEVPAEFALEQNFPTRSTAKLQCASGCRRGRTWP